MLLSLSLVLALAACKKDEPSPTTQSELQFRFFFDSTQARLDNFGQPATIPTGHAAQSPNFKRMSAHYIELAPSALTPLGQGEVLFHAPEVTTGGDLAIDFEQNNAVGQNEVFYKLSLGDVKPGDYEYLRVSLAYQRYDIHFITSQGYFGHGALASFVGYKTYIKDYVIERESVGVQGNRAQGYWGFEYDVLGFRGVVTGQAPAGATTVPNPLASTSPVPAGSCVVTGQFVDANGQVQPLRITGEEEEDIVIRVSLSTNKSFEWVDSNGDGLYNPEEDQVVDMGLRGLIPFIE